MATLHGTVALPAQGGAPRAETVHAPVYAAQYPTRKPLVTRAPHAGGTLRTHVVRSTETEPELPQG